MTRYFICIIMYLSLKTRRDLVNIEKKEKVQELISVLLEIIQQEINEENSKIEKDVA